METLPMVYVKAESQDAYIVHSRYNGTDETVSKDLWVGPVKVGAAVACKFTDNGWEFSCK